MAVMALQQISPFQSFSAGPGAIIPINGTGVQWISGNQISVSSGTNPFGYYADPTRDMYVPKTALDWLRGRVNEITSLAFSEVPA